MRLSNISTLSLAYRSSVRSRYPPASLAVFSLLKYDSSVHPPTASLAPRLMHSPSPRQSPQLTDVSLSITKRLLQDDGKDKNVVLSPLSIQVLLSIIAAGSTGPTLQQLLTFLKSNSVDELNNSASQIASIVFADGGSGPRLSFACGAWVDQSLSVNPSFKHLLQTTYKATLQQPDFRTKSKADEVISEVNSWVEKHTNGLITNILSPDSIKSDTYITLANALYFKGSWLNQFKASRTEHQNFYLLDGSSVEVPFMTSKEKQIIAAYDGFKVLEMPYEFVDPFRSFEECHFSMFIFLPDAKDGLPFLIEKLDSQPGFIDSHISRKIVEVREFKVPKFKFSFNVEVSKPLRKLGLVLPFVGGEGSLSNMVDSSQMDNGFATDIFHKACIEVNEEGTEASAATVMNLTGRSRRPPKLDVIDFVADHPFLFAIREDMTRTLIFVGQVLNPNIE